MKTLNVIGAGAAGRVLARLLQQHHLARIQAVVNRSADSAAAAAAWIGAGQPLDRIEDAPAAHCWLVGCPDDAIADVATRLAAGGQVRRGDIAFHLSGVLPAAALAPLSAHRASVHPVLSFADPDRAAAEFAGTRVAIEGDEVAAGELTEWLRTMGAQPFRVAGANKALYHAGSVIAANFPVVLLARATELYRRAGVEPTTARELALSLMRQAVANVAATDPQQALTGPARRGDAGTIAAHLAALPQADLPLYRSLTAAAVELARQSGRLSRLQARAVLAALDDDSLHPPGDPL